MPDLIYFKDFFFTLFGFNEHTYHRYLDGKRMGSKVFELKKKKKIKHVSPVATWVCQNLMWP